MKTKVTIIKDVENSQVKKGETGYIDGYATDLNEVPHAFVVINVPLVQNARE